MTDLFRRQAVDHQREHLFGAIVLTRHWSYSALTAVIVGLVVSMLFFASSVGFTRKETVQGVLVPENGLLRVTAPQAGVLTTAHVSDGQSVSTGEVLFVLSGERASASGLTQATVAQTLSERQSQIDQELRQHAEQSTNQGKVLDQRMANMLASLQLMDRELSLQRERIQLARDIAQRYPELVRSGAVSEVEAKEKSAELIDQQARLDARELARLGLQRELLVLQAQRKELPLMLEQQGMQLRRELQALLERQAENEASRAVQVRAHSAGRVVSIVAKAGQAVEKAQPLATLLPAGGSMEVELYAHPRAIGFLQTGAMVWLRYDAYPYQKFGQFTGRVRDISPSAIPLGDLPLAGAAPTRAGELVYRIRVQIDAQTVATAAGLQRLQPGMLVQASLVAERRTLFEWMFEPLWGMAKRS